MDGRNDSLIGGPPQVRAPSSGEVPSWRPVQVEHVAQPAFVGVAAAPSRVTLRRVILTTVRTDPTGFLYGGFGVGAYLQTSTTLPDVRQRRLGAHGTAVMEIRYPCRGFAWLWRGSFICPGCSAQRRRGVYRRR